MNSLSSEHHTEDTLEAKPVWADIEPPNADSELSLQDAAHTWWHQHHLLQWQSFLLGVCGPWMDRSLVRVLQQWQMQSMYFSSPGLIKSVVKSHWLTRIMNNGRQHCLAKPQFCQIWTISRGKKIHKHFVLVTENKQTNRLEKMNAIFILSGFWNSLSKFTSSNSHKKWNETM